MPNPTNIRQNRPALFSPSVIRAISQDELGSNTFRKVDYEAISKTAMDSTASFRYNLPGEGIRSTQQLNVDWSNFENHTFFQSAQVKTNVAFRKIFDQFPFDGTQRDTEIFLDSLTGFEKYVYDQFPKNKGYLFFSGTTPSEQGTSGTYVEVKDIAGVAYPGVSRNVTGQAILNPVSNSMTLEFQVYVPAQVNSGSFLLHKFATFASSGTFGYGVVLNPTGSTALGKFSMKIYSGSYQLSADAEVSKGQWNHLAFIWDRSPGVQKITSFVNGVSYATSSQIELGLLNMDSANLYIGSGSAIPSFTGSVTFSGALDELRIWHKIRTQDERDEFQTKGIFADTGLKLYLKFNEASGSQTPIVLDHAGNSLHGSLSSWAYSRDIRNIATASIAGASPMTYERLDLNPILFPLHPDVEDLNQEFLDNSLEFDRVNPNRIDRLIPAHYLNEGRYQDGLETEEGQIIEALDPSGATADTAKLGSTQIILSLLYTWAKFFDEMKLYTQAFGDLIHIDYDSTDTIPDSFLQLMASRFGISLPPLFAGTSLSQFVNAENLDYQFGTNDYSLQYIQNQIWRRILLNLQDILRSKGTIHSIKTLIRAVGIEPDNNFRIREFGGPTIRALENVRETRSEVSTLIDFSNGGLMTSPFLTGSRVEPGFPATSLAASASNNFLTSGSFTYEAIYRYPSTSSLGGVSQSLVRLHTTGSSGKYLYGNLLAIQNSGLFLYLNNAPTSASHPDLVLSVSADIFDGSLWHVSFGRTRGDEFPNLQCNSSSWFLRAARTEFGDIIEERVTSSWYLDGVAGDFLTQTSATGNASGSFLAIGKNTASASFIQGISSSNGAYSTFFDGRAGHIRFWSKDVSLEEWHEHVRNFKSLGVQDPLTNFNFVTNKTSSWERLRLDVSSDQVELTTDSSGFLQFVDFSQNNLHWSGSFPATSSVIVPQLFHYSLLSPKFDVGSTTEKIRVRSFQSFENTLSSSYAQVAPLYALEPSEKPQDNTRFTIDFSIVDALDQDIINIFATLDLLDNVIGNPELVFSPDYPELDNLRNVYFNRLVDRVNLKSFFEFYRWFDTNIGVFIAQLIPRKTKFLGINFVIESHMLERPKLEYQFSDIYLGDSNRHALKDTILFQQFVGSFSRF